MTEFEQESLANQKTIIELLGSIAAKTAAPMTFTASLAPTPPSPAQGEQQQKANP